MFVCRGTAADLIAGCCVEKATPFARLGSPFASLGWGVLGSNTSAPSSVKEKRTGVEFSGEFCYRHRPCPQITGTGTRAKKIAGIKNLDIYAFALYVDEHAARGRLRRKFSGQSAEEVAKSQALFDELVKAGEVEKSLVLVITSGLVKRANFLEALDERLAPPLALSKESAVLDRFRAQFDDVEFRKGLQIAFTVTSGSLVTTAAGKKVGSIHSKALTHALLEIYLGKDPVSRQAKAAFAKGLAGMVVA